MKWLSSAGLKRYLAAIIGGIAAVLAAVPGAELLVIWLQNLASALGGVGLAHAGTASNLKGVTSLNMASIIAILLTICKQFPQLEAAVPVLEMLAALFGGAAVQAGLKKYVPATKL